MCYGSGTPRTQAEALERYAEYPETYTITKHTMPDGFVVTQVKDKDDNSSQFFTGDKDTPSGWKYRGEQAKYLGKQLLAHQAPIDTTADTILVRTA